LKILVSGARERLGRTTLALNLSLGFSRLGREVFLLDLDPEHPEGHLSGLELEKAGVGYIQAPGAYKRLLSQNLPVAEIIIIDPGRLFNFSSYTGRIDLPLIVSRPQFYSLTESYGFAKMLAVALGQAEVFLVLNRVRRKREAMERLEPLFQVSERYFSGRLKLLGLVSEISGKKNSGFPLISFSGERFTREILELVKRIEEKIWIPDLKNKEVK